MKWITRERPKIDRIACPWLIKRFIVPASKFIFVPTDQVRTKAQELGAIPFDIPGIELSDEGEYCSFYRFIKKYKLTDEALYKLANIVRAAKFDLSTQAAGLWAISAGLSNIIQEDHQVLKYGFVIYDSLYNWCKYLQYEKHTWNPNL